MFFVRAVRYDVLQLGAEIQRCSAQPSIYTYNTIDIAVFQNVYPLSLLAVNLQPVLKMYTSRKLLCRARNSKKKVPLAVFANTAYLRR